jgi:hypothetical protein
VPDINLVSALAVLKANNDENNDYIDNFVPFVKEAIRCENINPVTATAIATGLKKLFDLSIPHYIINTIIGRIVDSGDVVRKGELLIPQDRVFNDTRYQKRHAEIIRKCNLLFARFIKFCADKGYEIEDSKDVEKSFFSCISSTIINAISKIEDETDDVGCETLHKMKHATGRFVQYIYTKENDLFEILEDVAKGNMLLSALYYSEANETKTLFKRTYIYLDTKIVLYLAGVGSPEKREPHQELCALLKSANAVVACFEHTVEEALNILKNAKQQIALASPRYVNESIQFFIDMGYLPSDVELFCSQLRRKIRANGIIITEKPAYDKNDGINEDLLEEHLESAVGYRNTLARDFDVQSISAIYRKREGEFNRQVETCKAIFATTNKDLARGTLNYFKEDFPNKRPDTFCMTSHRLANIAWAKLPQKAPDLPRKMIVSQCYAALKPREELWDKYVSELEKMVDNSDLSQEDYYYLRFSSASEDALSEYTLGDLSKVTFGSIKEILEGAKHKEHESILTELKHERAIREEKEMALRKQQESIFDLASRVSCFVYKFLYIAVVAPCVLYAGWNLFNTFPNDKLDTLDLIFFILSVAFFTTTTLLLLYSSDLRGFVSQANEKTAHLIARFISRLLGNASDDA